jgi:hypothetical protein
MGSSLTRMQRSISELVRIYCFVPTVALGLQRAQSRHSVDCIPRSSVKDLKGMYRALQDRHTPRQPNQENWARKYVNVVPTDAAN